MKKRPKEAAEIPQGITAKRHGNPGNFFRPAGHRAQSRRCNGRRLTHDPPLIHRRVERAELHFSLPNLNPQWMVPVQHGGPCPSRGRGRNDRGLLPAKGVTPAIAARIEGTHALPGLRIRGCDAFPKASAEAQGGCLQPGLEFPCLACVLSAREHACSLIDSFYDLDGRGSTGGNVNPALAVSVLESRAAAGKFASRNP